MVDDGPRWYGIGPKTDPFTTTAVLSFQLNTYVPTTYYYRLPLLPITTYYHLPPTQSDTHAAILIIIILLLLYITATAQRTSIKVLSTTTRNHPINLSSGLTLITSILCLSTVLATYYFFSLFFLTTRE